MGVHDAREILGTRMEFHCHHRFGNQFRGAAVDDMDTEYFVGLRVREDFDKST